MSSPVATVADLDRELAAQAATAQRVLAAEQARAHDLACALQAAEERIALLQRDLAGVQDELGVAREQLRLLHRIPVDLERLADRPAVRAGMRVGRLAQRVTRRSRG